MTIHVCIGREIEAWYVCTWSKVVFSTKIQSWGRSYAGSSRVGKDSTSLWDTGHRMRCISATAETMMERLAG